MASHNIPRPATIQQRSPQQLSQDKATIDKYRSLVHEIQSRTQNNQYTPDLLQLTTTLLKQNPEYYTIWNVRRRILTSGTSSTSPPSSSPSKASPNTGKTPVPNPSLAVSSSSTANTSTASPTTPSSHAHPPTSTNGTILETIETELAFVFPLLRAWPKCYWIWNHRVWCLQWATRVCGSEARRLWEGELKLVGIMLVKDNRNFHGWGYRRMVVEQLEREELGGKSMVEEEFRYTTTMFKANLSNFSAWHYRSVLIPRLLEERGTAKEERREFLDSEFNTIRDAYWTDPDDQSIWFYHQYLISDLINYQGKSSISIHFTTSERIEYLNRQLDDLKELLEDEPDCKWIYNALMDGTNARLDLEGRLSKEEEAKELQGWLERLKELDRFRRGRWEFVEERLRGRLAVS